MDFRACLKQAGIAGAGGAGFPSYAKLSDGADTLLINGAECEPLLYTDYTLLSRELPKILSGIAAVLENAGIARALLCVKEHTAERLQIADGTELSPNVILKALPNVYPMGDEVSLIYQATGRLVAPGNLPVSVGVIVFNVETVMQIAAAYKRQTPVTEKYITIGGAVQPAVVKVPLGMPVADLFSELSVTVPADHAVIDGGPSMGKIINPATAVVTKTTKGLLILPESCEAVRSKRIDAALSVVRAETACCQCTRCTDLCPRALLGYPLEPHKMVRTAKQAAEVSPALVLSATLCCGCGLCASLACCQGISPKSVIDQYKVLLAKNKMRYTQKYAPTVPEEREYRMIPSVRWAQTLGVAKFDEVPAYRGAIVAKKVSLLLKQHVGGAGVPCVKDGDRVEPGDTIAESGEGLSLPLHASIAGVVSVYADRIVIEEV